jgi:hypothetical protein
MASVIRRLLVREAPARDQMDLCVRMSMPDRPNGIKWDNWAKLTFVDTGKSVVCRLKGSDDKSGSVQTRRIHINSHLRDMLDLKSDTIAAPILQEFRIEKAPSWAFFWYIYRYHPDHRMRKEVLALTVMFGSIILGLIGIILPFILQ